MDLKTIGSSIFLLFGFITISLIYYYNVIRDNRLQYGDRVNTDLVKII